MARRSPKVTRITVDLTTVEYARLERLERLREARSKAQVIRDLLLEAEKNALWRSA